MARRLKGVRARKAKILTLTPLTPRAIHNLCLLQVVSWRASLQTVRPRAAVRPTGLQVYSEKKAATIGVAPVQAR